MKSKMLVWVGGIACLILLIPLIPYMTVFNGSITECHEKWGQFGDYFGGILNPVFALLAFFGVLYSISYQREEFEKNSAITQKQIKHLESSAKKEDFFRIIKSIDDEILDLLEVEVSSPGSVPRLQLKHIAHEAHRLRDNPNKNGAYLQFLTLSKSPGSIVESVYERITFSVHELYNYLKQYEALDNGTTGPISTFYARKHAKLAQILKDSGELRDEERDYFLVQQPNP